MRYLDRRLAELTSPERKLSTLVHKARMRLRAPKKRVNTHPPVPPYGVNQALTAWLTRAASCPREIMPA